jgi:hypothetical protein
LSHDARFSTGVEISVQKSPSVRDSACEAGLIRQVVDFAAFLWLYWLSDGRA